MSTPPYRKYCYWTDSEGLPKIRENTAGQGIELEEEVRIPCRVLRASIDIGYVMPAAWRGFCKRRTSWYWESGRTNKVLLVSNRRLDFVEMGEPIIIVESNFKPDRLPSPKDMARLILSKAYQNGKPSVWEKVEPLDREFYQKWFSHRRPEIPFDFDDIFRSHCANHANFIEPLFFVERNSLKAPYSISDSIHVCSSCLEFFDVLGHPWPVKYVVPCIGAVQFARLPMDRYMEVHSPPVRDRGKV